MALLFIVAIAMGLVLFGYGYLFNGISKTYLRGASSATIDDGTLFPSNTITKETSIPWSKDEFYNKKPLPKPLVEEWLSNEIASLIVIKNGKLLHEEYWGSIGENTPTNSFSMAKGITVLLLGKAIEEGKIQSEQQLFSEFYPDFKNSEFGKNLTLENLAKMEAGLNWDENYKNPFSPNAKAYYGSNLQKSVMETNFKEMPGTRFEYQSGATQILGFAIHKALNASLSNYLSSKFWIPLGMEHNAEWNTDNHDMEKSFCCINAISRDFAKLGLMMLNDGQFNGEQVINAKFIQKMKTPTPFSNSAYGMGIWINEDAKYKHYYFWGLLGQYIIMIPEKQMVIVKTGSYNNQPKDSKGRPKEVETIVNAIVEHYE